ncbi:MAG: hypothetical protein MJY58_05090 [Bacteroidaceae bacterium]|nr:hypothetical protein [Bacteroidaceae bacterium]
MMKKRVLFSIALAAGALLTACDNDSNDIFDPDINPMAASDQGQVILQTCENLLADIDVEQIQTFRDLIDQISGIDLGSIMALPKNEETVAKVIQMLVPQSNPMPDTCLLMPDDIHGHYKLTGDSLSVEPSDSLEFSIIQQAMELHIGIGSSNDLLMPYPVDAAKLSAMLPSGVVFPAIILALPSESWGTSTLNGTEIASGSFSGTFNYKDIIDGIDAGKDVMSVNLSATSQDSHIEAAIECKADNYLSIVLELEKAGKPASRISAKGSNLKISEDFKLQSLDELELISDFANAVTAVAKVESVFNLYSKLSQYAVSTGQTSSQRQAEHPENTKADMKLITTIMNSTIDTRVFLLGRKVEQGILTFVPYYSEITNKWTVGPAYTIATGQTFTHDSYAGLFDLSQYDRFFRSFLVFTKGLQK